MPHSMPHPMPHRFTGACCRRAGLESDGGPMSGWQNPDVTPVGAAPGSLPPAPVAPFGPAHDPFGSRPTRRNGRPFLVALGVLLIVGGVVGFVVGLLDVVGAGGDITADAVATGEVGVGGGVAATFDGQAGEPYTVYVRFGSDLVSDENEQEATVADTVCEVRHPDRRTSVIRGDRQAQSVTIGGRSSIGWFTAQDGETQVVCAYEQGSRYSRRNRAGSVGVVVTPGKPSVATAGFLGIGGGVVVTLLGGWVLVKGLRGKRVAVV